MNNKHHHERTKNHLPNIDPQEAHTGRAGGNQYLAEIGLTQAQESLAALKAGKIQLVEPMIIIRIGDKLVISDAAENTNPNRPSYPVDPRVGGIMDDVASGKRKAFGCVQTSIAVDGQPRQDRYVTFVEAKPGE